MNQDAAELLMTWYGMMARCYDRRHENYAGYGARGIQVCARWHVFANFAADMGKRPQGHTLDRKQNNGNYEPGNCKWSTVREQNRNKGNNVHITVDGVTKLAVDWARETGLSHQRICRRIKYGWTPEEAVGDRRIKQLEIKGVSKKISEWSAESGTPIHRIYQRLKQGWSQEDAVFRVVRGGGRTKPSSQVLIAQEVSHGGTLESCRKQHD